MERVRSKLLRRKSTGVAGPRRDRSFAALAICALAFLWTFPWQPERDDPHESVRVEMTAGIVEHASYGHAGTAPPGTSLLGIPAYAAHRAIASAQGRMPDRVVTLWLLRFTASILPTLIFLFFFHDWIGRETNHP